MAFRTDQPNFSKGEIAPELQGRVDVAYYGAALRRARNVIVRKYGGVTKRPGTRFVAEALDATKPLRLIPFEFSDTQTYAIEMGQAYARFLSGGGLILNQGLTITGISNAAQATVTAQNHGYAVNDQVYFSGVAGMVQINGRLATVVSVIDANTFVVTLDTRAFSAFAGDSGGIVNPTPPPPPAPAPVVPPVVPDQPAPIISNCGGSGNGGAIP